MTPDAFPDDLLSRIAACIERGKVNLSSPHPPDLRGTEGADELTRIALERDIPAQEVLTEGLMVGMRNVGEKFRQKIIFVPDVLMAARAMHAAMAHLKPHFAADGIRHAGTFLLGTVMGDLHDIGKRLVGMVAEGAGWNVVDLGTDVPPGKFIEATRAHPGAVVGMSALLTTTMSNMERTVAELKSALPATRVIVGGAPVTQPFAVKIGADAYSPDPQGAVEFLQSIA
jgi:5-methyltetrahydrofolate--homocysteine methyltransferase